MPAAIDNIPPEKRGNPAWRKGAASPNPGGRPRKLVEIETMLDAEHRTVANMRDVFGRLKALALGEVVTVAGKDGSVYVSLRADARFMDLYLNRVLGPVKDLKIDLTDAPDAVVEYLAEKLH